MVPVEDEDHYKYLPKGLILYCAVETLQLRWLTAPVVLSSADQKTSSVVIIIKNSIF